MPTRPVLRLVLPICAKVLDDVVFKTGPCVGGSVSPVLLGCRPGPVRRLDCSGCVLSAGPPFVIAETHGCCRRVVFRVSPGKVSEPFGVVVQGLYRKWKQEGFFSCTCDGLVGSSLECGPALAGGLSFPPILPGSAWCPSVAGA